MNVQIITTPAGERLVMLPEAEYLALVAVSEDIADRASVAEFRSKLARGEEEFVPAEVADRILAGENRIRVWRGHRGLTANALAARAEISQAFLSQIESGRREGGVETLRRIATALDLTLDDLVG